MGRVVDVTVREATETDQLDVRRLIDAAMLVVDDLDSRLADGTVLLACDGSNRVMGTIVLEEEYVVAIAVTRSLRGQGIGTRLIETALDRTGRLVAEFERELRPFYQSLGFDIGPAAGEDRLRGVYDPEGSSCCGKPERQD